MYVRYISAFNSLTDTGQNDGYLLYDSIDNDIDMIILRLDYCICTPVLKLRLKQLTVLIFLSLFLTFNQCVNQINTCWAK